MSDIRFRLATVLFAACSMAAFAIPYPGYYFPSSMQAGTKLRVLVGGTGMGGVKGAYVTGDGVEITKIVRVPNFPRAPGKTQPGWIMGWFYDIIEGKDKKHRDLPPEALDEKSDWEECLWWPYLDERDDLEMQIIGRWWSTPESYPQATPALDQLVLLDVEAKPTATPGRRDIVIFDDNGASAPHSFFITKEPHACERFFVIPTREEYKRRKLPAILHLPTELDVLTPPVHIDGQAWPGETDSFKLRLKKGQHLVCDVKGREFMPFQGDAVPGWFNPAIRLYDADGREVAFADDFYYLPDPILTYAVPKDGVYRLDIHDNLFRGRQDCVYMISCHLRDDDLVPFTPGQRAFECFPPAAAHVPPPADGKRILKKGTLNTPKREDRHFLDIKEPGEWKFELFARRLGSPVDGVLKLYGPMGKLPLKAAPRLAVWDDDPGRLYSLKNVGDDDKPIIKTNMLYVGSVTQTECDSVGTWKFMEPGRYCVTVSDRIGAGAENYDYVLCMEPYKPTFEVYSSTSAFVVGGGRGARFKAHVLRRGFKGPIVFDSTDDYDVSGGFYDDDEVETEVTISPKKELKGITCIQITASGERPNGEKVTVRVTPCDSAEQAFAYTHLLPQIGFFLCAPHESDIVYQNPHPLPHLPCNGADGKGGVSPMKKKRASHSNGQACTACHDKKNKDHTHGQACTSCHKNKN